MDADAKETKAPAETNDDDFVNKQNVYSMQIYENSVEICDVSDF